MTGDKKAAKSRLALMAKIFEYVWIAAIIVFIITTLVIPESDPAFKLLILLLAIAFLFVYLYLSRAYFKAEVEILKEEKFRLLTLGTEPADMGVTLRTPEQ